MAVSRAAVERAGLLDEELFAYVEDVDWSLRSAPPGFAVVFVPGRASCLHKGSASTGGERVDDEALLLDPQHDRVSERDRPLPPGLRSLRRGVVVATHLAQAASHERRREAARPCSTAGATPRGRAGPR